MSKSKSLFVYLLCSGLGAAMGLFISCYSPDLAKQVYRCDYGKCPQGLSCYDGVYCTQRLPQCTVGGIESSPGVAACIGSTKDGVCTGGATTAKCDSMGVTKELCTGLIPPTQGADLGGIMMPSSVCAYCCN
jgi:hypothetical protein